MGADRGEVGAAPPPRAAFDLGIPWGDLSEPPTDEQAHGDLLRVLDWCTPQEVVVVRDALRQTLRLDSLLNATGGLERDESGGGSVLVLPPISYYSIFNGADTARCLMGHIARARGTTYNALVWPRPSKYRPIERWLVNILIGMDAWPSLSEAPHEGYVFSFRSEMNGEHRRRAALLDTWLTDWLDARTIELPSRAEVRDA